MTLRLFAWNRLELLRRMKGHLVAFVRRVLQSAARWLVHRRYRIEARGLDRIPDEGPALLTCNHVSYLDAVLIYALCDRPVRFVMHYRLYRLPLLKSFFRLMGVIPIASHREAPDVLDAAYDHIAAALRRGELVGLFPEGQITYDGEINRFRTGVERIIERTPVPVVPMALRGLWGSFFSRLGGAGRRGRFGRSPSRIALAVEGTVAPEAVTAARLEAIVRRLRGRRR